MYIVLGASGQVGSAVARQLLEKKLPVKGIVREQKKGAELEKQGANIGVADALDLPSLKSAFENGEILFVITPETGKSEDVLKETRDILDNYRAAIQGSGIRKVVGLSSVGAQHASGKGNLEMSYMLEHAFEGLPVHQVFIRPAYYFSNWAMSLEQIKTDGVLHSFYPVELPIHMISPQDVAQIAAEIMVREESDSITYELEGPQTYTALDVAAAFAKALGREVKAEQIPHEQWEGVIKKMGFTDNATHNFIKMTEAVIDGSAVPEGHGVVSVKGFTTLEDYINDTVKNLKGLGK